MDYRAEARAKLLDEAHSLFFSSHHKMNWLNVNQPHEGDLTKIKEQLEESLRLIQRVIDDDVFDPYKI